MGGGVLQPCFIANQCSLSKHEVASSCNALAHFAAPQQSDTSMCYIYISSLT